MANCVIGYGNIAELATLSGGTYNANAPRNNLLDPNPGKLARTVDDSNAATTFTFSFATRYLIQFFGLINTNASLDATWRLRLYSGANLAGTLLYDSTTLTLYPPGSMPWGTVPWTAPNWWTGKPTYDDLSRYQRNILLHIPGAPQVQSGKFELFDTTNPDTYFQAGRLFLGRAFQPQMGMVYGASVQVTSRSLVARSQAGNSFVNRLPSDISFPFALPVISKLEERRVLDLHVTSDTSGEVIFMRDPTDKTSWMGRSVYGRLSQLNPLQHSSFANYETSFQIEGNLP